MPGRTSLKKGQTQTSKEEGGSTTRTTAQIEKYYSGGKRPFSYKKNDRGKIVKIPQMLSGGQAKIAAKAPPPNKIDEKDFAVLRAEKAKGRGMGLQDEKVKPGKVMKASVGGESRDDKLRKAFPRKSPESRAKIETMLGSKNTPMKKERLFEGDKARRKEAFKKLLKNVRKAIPGVGMLDVKVTKKSKGGGADTGKRGELRSKLAVAMDRAKKGMGSRPGLGGRLSREDIKKATDILKNKKPKSGSSVKDIFKSYGKYDGKPIELSKGGGADMGTKMSDKRRKKLKDILSRLTAPRTINIKPEFKSGTSNPMQRERKREGYRAKVEKAGGRVMFGDERGMKKFKNFMGGGMMNKPMGYKKGASIMARGCKLGRKKTTKLY